MNKNKVLWFLFSTIAVILILYPMFTSIESFEEQQTFRIGILISGHERLEKINGLKDGLNQLGYIEGVNLEYKLMDAENSLNLMEQYAKELDSDGLDVIIAGGAIETKYLKENKVVETPVVFLGVADAINLGLITSYKEPGGRITGVENAHVELSAKRLQLYKLLLPNIERIVVIYDENIEASLLSLEKVDQIAKELEVELLPLSVRNERQLSLFKAFPYKETDGLLVLPSYYLEEISPQLGTFAIEKKLPIFGVNLNDIQNDFLMSYGVSYYNQGYQGASMVSQILTGIKPGEIPVEKPDTIRLLVNRQTEKELGIIFSKVGNAFINRIDVEE